MDVAVVMGSDSDFDVVRGAVGVLEEFGVSFEARVLSAHRTPTALHDFLSTCDASVYIAAAGGAAHLAGVVAAETTRPVIALPIQGKSLNGLDSLLSMVQMPPGVPVACVGVGAARNAGLLAIEILAVADSALSEKLTGFRKAQVTVVAAKNKSVQDQISKK